MKKILKYLFIAILGAGLMYSCKEDENLGEEKPFFYLDDNLQAVVTYRAVGGDKFFDVKTNMKFDVLSSNEEWCIPTIVGRGKSNLKITVLETDQEEERPATVTIKAEDGKTYEVSILQSGAPVPPPPFAAGDARVAAANPALYYSFENADRTSPAVPAGGDVHVEFTSEPSVVSGPGSGKMALNFVPGNSIKVPTPDLADKGKYTMMFDVKVNSWVDNKYIGILQANPDNTTDAALFIQPNGKIGSSQYTAEGTIAGDTWYRIVIVVGGADNTYKLYLNGELILTNTSGSVKNKISLNGGFFWLFNDEDGEIGDVDCAGFAIWPDLLTDDQVAELGSIHDIDIPSNIDSNVKKLNPTMYYAFTDASDYRKPTLGDLPVEFTTNDGTPTTVSVSTAPAGKTALFFPAGTSIKVPKPALADDGKYSVMFDVKVVDWVNNKYIDLLQPNPANNSDGILFIQPNGKIGASSYTAEGTIVRDTWYRIVVAVGGDNTFKLYINGDLVQTNTSSGPKGRSLLTGEFFWLFNDEDGEIGDLDCAGFAFWDHILTDDEAADLGSL